MNKCICYHKNCNCIKVLMKCNICNQECYSNDHIESSKFYYSLLQKKDKSKICYSIIPKIGYIKNKSLFNYEFYIKCEHKIISIDSNEINVNFTSKIQNPHIIFFWISNKNIQNNYYDYNTTDELPNLFISKIEIDYDNKNKKEEYNDINNIYNQLIQTLSLIPYQFIDFTIDEWLKYYRIYGINLGDNPLLSSYRQSLFNISIKCDNNKNKLKILNILIKNNI